MKDGEGGDGGGGAVVCVCVCVYIVTRVYGRGSKGVFLCSVLDRRGCGKERKGCVCVGDVPATTENIKAN